MRSASRAARVLALSLAAAAGATAAAREAGAQLAAEPSYGRVRGDVTLVGGVGAVVAEGGVRGEGEARVRYLESAGLFVAYEEGFGVASTVPARLLATGLEVRPFFLYRWLRGLETRRARFDLVVDSLGLELGATFAQPVGASFASRNGVELGLGVEVPLSLEATGAWIGLHGGIRWSDAWLSDGVARDAGDRAAFVTLTLAWHQVVLAHVVDTGDEAPR
jgi:hypothetical protein